MVVIGLLAAAIWALRSTLLKFNDQRFAARREVGLKPIDPSAGHISTAGSTASRQDPSSK
jgi:hypothetical protein